MIRKRTPLAACFALFGLLALAGCSESGAEEAGESIDNAIDEAGDAIEDAGDGIKDAVDDLGD